MDGPTGGQLRGVPLNKNETTIKGCFYILTLLLSKFTNNILMVKSLISNIPVTGTISHIFKNKVGSTFGYSMLLTIMTLKIKHLVSSYVFVFY